MTMDKYFCYMGFWICGQNSLISTIFTIVPCCGKGGNVKTVEVSTSKG